jgi:PTH1 family peptidyl-tRNA hydrolase
VQIWVGLGNPGAQYAMHRHNVGFMAVDAIAEVHGFEPPKKSFHGWAQQGRIGGERILLLKPATFMNDSGRAVRAAMDFFKKEVGDVTVFHDELDLAPFKVKVKTGGGTAGHNGLRSTEAHVGNAFRRVRIGIGHPGAQGPGDRPRARQLRQGGDGRARRHAGRDRRRSGVAGQRATTPAS